MANINRGLLVSTCGLLVLSIGLLIALIVVATSDNKEVGTPETLPDQCEVVDHSFTDTEPKVPGVFHDLTKTEIAGLQKYLYEQSNLDLVRPSKSKTNANYVFVAELHLPNKSEVLAHLDNGTHQPIREAKVIIIRGKAPDREINELIVGPLPSPLNHRPLPGINASIPYFYRPMTEEDYGSVINSITDEVEDGFGNITEKCFGARLKNCGNECLSFLYASSFSPGSSGVDQRKTWYWLTYDIEYYTLHPVDFAILAGVNETGVHIDKVWFSGTQFNSLDAASVAYKSNTSICQPQRNFPPNKRTLFSTLNKRGDAPAAAKKRGPKMVEPDGKRYTVNGRHVEYMKWAFDFRMSTAYGPQVYDVRFDGERIVYEMGLQEVSVFYSGHSPQQRFSDYMDSAELIGPAAQGLIPGVDCPDHATFFDTMHVTESSETPDVIRNVFCLFELNTGEPLRRHFSYFDSEGRFFEGMENNILVLRTVVTVVNYDYVFDFRFFQNGVIETKGISTGYVLGNAFTEMEKKYGFRIQEFITANYHTHLFNFKVDLDVKGTTNRYEVVHIDVETEPNEFSFVPGATYSQGKLRREVKLDETSAAYKFDFEKPKYHIFYNDAHKDKYGNQRAYRLLHKGMVKQIIPAGHNKEPAINWARYQFAVTRQKDHEAHSSSMYSMFDINDQVVNFESYINDNETIIDQDLVLWITSGVHHIPHKEDLPVTTTPGMGLSFYLQPFNYFDEDPSMYSPNAIRMEPRDGAVFVERYDELTETEMKCVPEKTNYLEKIESDTSLIFESVDD
ncbi:putative amine oxidase [copper-containing] [Mya arenaria]|uniref:putative amine oxidase [copper-containing] n=1 Tax=Mya arenaria TaxID=6604 RepID=UPI0022DFBF0E|nr:putative amine oxidase [copper-containing] [Mya arenaria]